MKPLEGKAVLVTRPAGQSDAFAARLKELGATPILLPAIDIAPPADLEPLDQALCKLNQFDWLVLTSVNGVQAIARRLDQLKLEVTNRPKLAVIGPATAAAAEPIFGKPDAIPDEFVSEAIADELGDVGGAKILLARADLARQNLAEILAERGAHVTCVDAYSIELKQEAELSTERAPDYITLTSSAVARSTHALLESKGLDWWRSAEIVCIGPITAETVRELGREPAAVAQEYTIDGVLQSLIDLAKKEAAHV